MTNRRQSLKRKKRAAKGPSPGDMAREERRAFAREVKETFPDVASLDRYEADRAEGT